MKTPCMSGSVFASPLFSLNSWPFKPPILSLHPHKNERFCWFPCFITVAFCPEIQIACFLVHTWNCQMPLEKTSCSFSFCLPGILIPHPQCIFSFSYVYMDFKFLFVCGVFSAFLVNLNNTGLPQVHHSIQIEIWVQCKWKHVSRSQEDCRSLGLCSSDNRIIYYQNCKTFENEKSVINN